MPNCAKSGVFFEVTSEELEFLDKITPTFADKKFPVPAPKISPEERRKRRTSHRNERFLYQNKSVLTDERLISIYRPDTNFKIYKKDDWFSDKWDPMDFGRDFDLSRSFFEQFGELQREVPKANIIVVDNENSEYTTGTGYCKNCYLINSSEYCEDCYYGKLFQRCSNIVDSAYMYDSELCYECIDAKNCYDCKYVYNSQNTSNSWFCDALSSCQSCFLCTNLVGKKYYFENQELGKEKYQKRIKEILDNPENFQQLKQKFDELRKSRTHKYANIINCENCQGDFITSSRNCKDCYDVNDGEDCRNVQVGVKVKDLFDCSNMYLKPELSYEVLGVIETYNVHFCLYIFYSNNLWYCDQCFSCQDCFGCVGLRHKKNCIFNKQYSKEEYEQKVAEIITCMQKSDEWGEFFPITLSPFGYNESLANEYFPLSKESAQNQGFNWSDYQAPSPKVEKIIPASKLPFDIKRVPDEILGWAIECEESKKLFMLQKAELNFYRKMGLPVPRFHPDVRYDNRMKLRNPRKLYSRECNKCDTLIQTTYSPDRPEIVYCEKCYRDEVY